jgi:hypothetical protein
MNRAFGPLDHFDSSRGALQPLQILTRQLKLREQPFLRLKLSGVHTTPPCAHAYRMLQMQHLVVQQVFDGVARCSGPVEDATDDDGIVCGVVVAEHPFGDVGAPCQRRPSQQAMKEAQIDGLKDLVEVVEMSLRRADAFPSAVLPDTFCLLRYRLGLRVAAIAIGMDWRNRFAVQLGQQDMRNGVMDRLRGVHQQVGETDNQLPIAQANCCIQAGKATELNLQQRHGSSRAKLTVLLREDREEFGRDRWQSGHRHGFRQLNMRYFIF